MSTKGQVVIPLPIRRELGLAAGDDFQVTRRNDEVILRKIGRRSSRKLSEHLAAFRGLELKRWDQPLFPEA